MIFTVSVTNFGYYSMAISLGKFQDFSLPQILREINFEESGSAKNAVFAILGAVNFVHLVNIRLLKVQKFMKIKIQSF